MTDNFGDDMVFLYARLVLFLTLFAIGACSSDIGPYATSADNILSARALAKDRVGRVKLVESSAAKPQSWISCRGIAVGLPNDEPFHIYIAKALEDELKLGNLTSPDGNINLGIYLSELNFSSWEGTWEIVTDISVNGEKIFSATGFQDHDAAWTAVQECENAADNFVYAVQDLTKNIINNPKFKNLFTNRNGQVMPTPTSGAVWQTVYDQVYAFTEPTKKGNRIQMPSSIPLSLLEVRGDWGRFGYTPEGGGLASAWIALVNVRRVR